MPLLIAMKTSNRALFTGPPPWLGLAFGTPYSSYLLPWYAYFGYYGNLLELLIPLYWGLKLSSLDTLPWKRLLGPDFHSGIALFTYASNDQTSPYYTFPLTSIFRSPL